jgi:acyl-CoA synthetase (NDP forming)
LTAIPGDKAVLKIVSPTVIHKTEVGRVQVVPKTSEIVHLAMHRIFYKVSENYTGWIERQYIQARLYADVLRDKGLV